MTFPNKLAALAAILTLSSVQADAQTLKSLQIRRFGSGPEFSKPCAADIWLPEGFSRANRYPLLFTFGTQDAGVLAKVAAYYAQWLDRIPPVVVVGLDLNTDQIGYNYETGDVTDSGKQLVAFLKDELFPTLQREYSVGPYKAYLGHSYGASYVDYLLRKQPNWFNAYALFAPEQPRYTLDYGSLIKNLHSPVYMYLSSATGDLERRQEHAKLIAKGIEEAQVSGMHFLYESYPNADHRTITPKAIPSALEHLLGDFKNYDYHDSDGDLASWFTKLNDRIKSYYGMPIPTDAATAGYFTGLAGEKQDVKALRAFEKYFLSERSDASTAFNTAQAYLDLDQTADVERLFRQSIRRSRVTGQPDFNLMSYRTLGWNLYSAKLNDPKRAWEVLEEGYKESGDAAYQYFLGVISARHGYRTDDGIRYLLQFEKDRLDSSFGDLYSLSLVYLQLAKCYRSKSDLSNAKMYVRKSLEKDPNNAEASDLAKQLGN